MYTLGYDKANMDRNNLCNRPFDDPNSLFARDDDEQSKQFLDSQNAPHYRNSSDSELKRKQESVKAIVTALQK